MRNLICDLSHELIKPYVTKKDIMVDMTMGNGLDTIFLASIAKFVYAFDIQEKALIETKKKLDLHGIKNVSLIHDSHENFLNYVTDFKGFFFNLGYLPGGDHLITTTAETTIKTLDLILPKLKKDGFILYVIYPGHEEGKVEALSLHQKLSSLDPMIYKIVNIDLPYQQNQPPYIRWIIKQKDDL